MSELRLLCLHFKSLLKFCHIDKIFIQHTHTDFAIFYMLQQLFSTLRQEFWNKKTARFYIQDIRFSVETSKINSTAVSHSLATSFYNASICTQQKPNYLQVSWQKCPLIRNRRALSPLVPGSAVAAYISKDLHELYSPHCDAYCCCYYNVVGIQILHSKTSWEKPTHAITHSAISDKVLHNCWDLPQQSSYKTKGLFHHKSY